jgi:hypothetical protein
MHESIDVKSKAKDVSSDPYNHFLSNSPRIDLQTSNTSNMQRQFHFITIPEPNAAMPLDKRRARHSHATRETHTKQRRLRIRKYQEEAGQGCTLDNFANIDVHLSSPYHRLAHSNASLISALPRHLSAQEYFLLDHCTSRFFEPSAVSIRLQPGILHAMSF